MPTLKLKAAEASALDRAAKLYREFERNDDEFTTGELAEYLGVDIKKAARFLAALERDGRAAHRVLRGTALWRLTDDA